jgi:hypothetical protein
MVSGQLISQAGANRVFAISGGAALVAGDFSVTVFKAEEERNAVW